MYNTREVKFMEQLTCLQWQVKWYSLTLKGETNLDWHTQATEQLPKWISLLEGKGKLTCKIATLILHTAYDYNYSILFTWVDENVLALSVYRSQKEKPDFFELISANGIVSCVWELGIIWHERNAWIKHVLNRLPQADIIGYLNSKINGEI